DKRYKYMMEDLCNNDNVYQIGFNIQNLNIHEMKDNDISKFDIILFPMNGINENMEVKSEKGNIKLDEDIFKTLNNDALVFTGLKTPKLLELIPKEQIISFLDDEEVEEKNNSLTVDGTIEDIKDRKNDSVCILGYGNLGKELYLRLSHAGINTYVISRPKELIYKDKVKNYYPLSSQNITEVFKICDIVINTIPYNVIPEDAVSASYVPYILDIASAPYGINQNLVKKYPINYNLYLGIPSKFAPKEAADILLKVLKKVR
ncbi:MAG: NAD(P)-binding domain-containing protein, partial [Clostridia bacterium]|nr:NAD(P)-binding domain-containing protein [Clostridia bacterium]